MKLTLFITNSPYLFKIYCDSIYKVSYFILSLSEIILSLSNIISCIRNSSYMIPSVSDVGVRSIALYCPQIRELSLSDCSDVSDYGLCELAKLGPSLRYLSVSKCPKISDTGVRQLVSHCYKIRYLNLRGCLSITDSTVVSLSRSCTRLRSLDLGKCDVTDAGLHQIARHLQHIRKVSVRGCGMVGDQGVVALARGCPHLVHLNIMDCEVSLQACKIVATHCRHCYIETNTVS